jgi:hypothetical protein
MRGTRIGDAHTGGRKGSLAPVTEGRAHDPFTALRTAPGGKGELAVACSQASTGWPRVKILEDAERIGRACWRLTLTCSGNSGGELTY